VGKRARWGNEIGGRIDFITASRYHHKLQFRIRTFDMSIVLHFSSYYCNVPTRFDMSIVLLLAPGEAASLFTPLFLDLLNTQSQKKSPSNFVGRCNTSSNSCWHLRLTALSLFPNSSLFQSARKTTPFSRSMFRASDVYQFRNHRTQKGSYDGKS
jgi:hypothetical protein